MGQYYRPLIIHADGRLDVLRSFDFDNMQKLMEHSWIGNSFVNAVYSLIEGNLCRIVWMGDYASSEVTEEFIRKAGGFKRFESYFKAAWGKGKKNRVKPAQFAGCDLTTFVDFDTKGTYLVNHTQKIYLFLEKYIAKNTYKEKGCRWDWCINPLPLLTACMNGDGGSYYGTDMDYVGSWAFDLLEYSDKFPDTYKEVMYHFKENM